MFIFLLIAVLLGNTLSVLGASQRDIDAVFNNSIYYDDRILPSSCSGATGGGLGVTIEQYLQAIAFEESNGDPNALNPGSFASGKYQFLPGTWDFMQNIYPPAGNYSDARLAPEAIQDAAALVFTAFNSSIIAEDPNREVDAFWLAVAHFRGAGFVGDLDEKAPGHNTETTREYVSEVLGRIEDGRSTGIPILFDQSPNLDENIASAGYGDLRNTVLGLGGVTVNSGFVDCSGFGVSSADINLFDGGFENSDRTLRSADGIVLHWTAGFYGDRQPQGVVDVLNSRGLGVQFYVGADGRIWQLTPRPDSFAAHACGVNSTTIGIEIEGLGAEDLLGNQTQTQSVINLVASLSGEFGISVVTGDPRNGSGLLGHHETPAFHSGCSGKSDPGPVYLELVRQAVLNGEATRNEGCPAGVAENDGYRQHCDILQEIIAENGSAFSSLKQDKTASGGLLAESRTSQIGPTRVATDALTSYNNMVRAAANDGVVLEPVSGYRSFEEQALQRIHFCSNNQSDVSFERIFLTPGGCSTSVALPGNSNHNQGRAVDFGVGGITDQPSFANTDQFEWLSDNAAAFGWNTISNEPWHWENP